MAGTGQIIATINAFGGISHTFDWAFNNTGGPVKETVDMPVESGAAFHYSPAIPARSACQAGPYNRLARRGDHSSADVEDTPRLGPRNWSSPWCIPPVPDRNYVAIGAIKCERESRAGIGGFERNRGARGT